MAPVKAEFAGVRVIVTGAAAGIGLATAKAFAKAGARVGLIDIDRGKLGRAARSMRAPQVARVVADLSNPQEASAAVAAAADELGGANVLVNNAAIYVPTAWRGKQAGPGWDRVIATNLDSVYHCAKAALPSLKRADSACIVNVASTQGVAAQLDSAAYCAAKGGVVNLTRAMAVDFAPAGIRVNAVAPGYIDTAMAIMPDGRHEHAEPVFKEFYLKRRRIPLGRPGQPEDVAGPILFLAGKGSAYITGQVLAVDGGMLATY